MKREWLAVSATVSSDKISQKTVSSGSLRDGGHIGSIRVRYELKGLWKDKIEYNGQEYVCFISNETGNTQEAGAPLLPQEGLLVALPKNARFKELKVIESRQKEMKIEMTILPTPKSVREGEEVKYIQSPQYYQSQKDFPGKTIEYLSTSEIAGMRAVHIILYLAQYAPLLKKLSWLEYIDFEVVYEIVEVDAADISLARRVNKSLASVLLLGYGEQIDSYRSKINNNDNTALDSSLKSPTNKGDFLIVTTNELKSAFDRLCKVRSTKFEVKIAVKEDIFVEFPDTTEEVSIKKFLNYAVQNWEVPPQYVILGGNVDKIPTCIRSYDNSNIVSDHYYADLNDTMTPELTVSRFPASTVDDMKKLCDTAIAYPTQNGIWSKDVLLTTNEELGYEICKDGIYNDIKSHFNPIKRYGSDPTATKVEVMRCIDAGVSFINYRGHGASDKWLSNNGMQNGDILMLKNNKKLPHVFSIACSTNKINYNPPVYDCFGATWMINQKAASFLGASIESYTTVNDYFDRYLWDAIMNHNLKRIGDIFNYATMRLYYNHKPSSSINANIYMYLLLGDPTMSYKEKVLPTSFVLMLDRSASMTAAIEQVKIDAKAFIRESRINDQFGINSFNQNANWVYPTGTSPQIVTVTDVNDEPKKAEIEIDKIYASGSTNIGDAISLGKQMLDYETPNIKALVLLSDGEKNVGPVPESVLGTEVPIFVAGLGPYLRKKYFDKMLALNSQSQYYHGDHASDMALIFNDIRALAPYTRLASNKIGVYSGSDYQLVKAQITKDSGKTQFSVVWPDKRFTYTSGYPNGFNICVNLVQPNGKRLKREPEIVGEGYCIFNMDDTQPGEWGILVEYAVGNIKISKEEKEEIKGAIGAFQFETDINLNFDLPNISEVGKPLGFKLDVLNGNNPIENLKVDVEIKHPTISLDNALVKYADDLKKVNVDRKLLEVHANSRDGVEKLFKLQAFREQNMQKFHKDILGVENVKHQLEFSRKDGKYDFIFNNTLEAGSYSFRINVSGIDPMTGQPVAMTTSRAVLVG